jgi:lysophospholipase L1-like esterase
MRGLSPGWHAVSLTRSGDRWTLELDGRTVGSGARPAAFTGPIGFRGGAKSADVDDIVVETEGGQAWSESFRNSKNQTRAFLSCLALLLLMATLRRKTFVRTLAGVSIAGILSGALWLPFDFFYWSRVGNTPLTNNVAERARFHVFEFWNRMLGGEEVAGSSIEKRGYPLERILDGPIYCRAGEVCKRVNEDFVHNLPRGRGARIAFVGSSQTVGSGAAWIEQTPFGRLHTRLSKELPTRLPLESLNLGVSGSQASKLWKTYQAQYASFAPDLMVINLSCNGSLAELSAGVEGFLEWNRTHGTRTVLVEEPVVNPKVRWNPELEPIDLKYAKLKEEGKTFGVSVLPMNEFFGDQSVRQTGFLWWDYVHQTPYGQELAARWLEPRLLHELRLSRALASP